MNKEMLARFQKQLDTAKSKKALRDALFLYIKQVAEEFGFDPPVKMSEGYDGRPAVSLAWDGPYEWAIWLCGGSCLFAGETGDISTAGEIDVSRNKKFFFECETGSMMSAWDV